MKILLWQILTVCSGICLFSPNAVAGAKAAASQSTPQLSSKNRSPGPVYSASSPSLSRGEVASSNVPEVLVKPGLTDRVYSTSLNTTSATPSRAPFELGFSLKAFQPTTFEVANDYYKISYQDQSRPLSGVDLVISLPAFVRPAIDVRVLLGASYFYSQDERRAKAAAAFYVHDSVELQWIPLYTGFAVHSGRMSRAGLRVGVVSTAGVDAIAQRGYLDGMSQTHWVPRYEAGPDLVVFDREEDVGFDGITVGGRYTSSFNSDQSIKGWMIMAGSRVAF